MSIFPTAWTASVWKRVPFERQISAASSIGKSVPVSLLAHIRETIAVSSRIARSRSSRSIKPSESTSSHVTSYPRLANASPV